MKNSKNKLGVCKKVLAGTLAVLSLSGCMTNLSSVIAMKDEAQQSTTSLPNLVSVSRCYDEFIRGQILNKKFEKERLFVKKRRDFKIDLFYSFDGSTLYVISGIPKESSQYNVLDNLYDVQEKYSKVARSQQNRFLEGFMSFLTRAAVEIDDDKDDKPEFQLPKQYIKDYTDLINNYNIIGLTLPIPTPSLKTQGALEKFGINTVSWAQYGDMNVSLSDTLPNK